MVWDRILTFPLDAEGAAVPFSTRLRRENRWSALFTQRVIEEYRRFAFLSVVAGHLVTPSEAVDQAWHLHLFYTQSYWGEFCKNALGRPLHHSPSQGGPLETQTFDEAYRRTLESYERFFGESPPSDIWPAPEAKRTLHHEFVRVDVASHWVIPKLRLSLWIPCATIGLLGLVVVGCTAQGASFNPFELDGPGFLGFYSALLAVCVALALTIRYFVRLPGPSDLAALQDLTPLEAACLSGNELGSLKAVVGALVVCGYLKVHPTGQRVETIMSDVTGLDPLAAHIVTDCEIAGGRPILALYASTALSLLAIHDRLVQRQLMLGAADRLKAGLLAAAVAGAPLLVGIPRIFLGVAAGHPVGFLVGLCILTIFLPGAFLVNSPKRTLRGDAVLRRQRESRASVRSAPGRTQPSLPETTLAIGLFGLAVVPPMFHDDVKSLMSPSGSGSSSGSCGSGSSCGNSGCGGGGCGGGCGG